jgi:hypothetical protein
MEIKSEDSEVVVVDALIGVGDPFVPPGTPLEFPPDANTITAAMAAAGQASHFLMSA